MRFANNLLRVVQAKWCKVKFIVFALSNELFAMHRWYTRTALLILYVTRHSIICSIIIIQSETRISKTISFKSPSNYIPKRQHHCLIYYNHNPIMYVQCNTICQVDVSINFFFSIKKSRVHNNGHLLNIHSVSNHRTKWLSVREHFYPKDIDKQEEKL